METTLLDHSYGSSRIAPSRTSDIDFGDVFGGPPRGSSIHGSMRYSFTDGADSVAAARRLGKTTSFRDPWASTEQKPVFGGVVEGGSRRWSLQEDFFVDIFGGSESLRSRTPRKHDRDVFSASSRGWRSLSSAWPLPPRAEGFVDPSSEPTQFSLPDKLSNPVDSPAFVSPARASYNDAASNGTTRLHSPKISVFRFSSRAVRVRDEPGNNGPQHLPGTLSQRFPRGTDDSLGLTKHEKMDDLEKRTGNPRGDAHSSWFQFSMYKWASKGVATTDNGREVSESPYATPFNIDDRKVTVERSPRSSENGLGRKRPMGKVKDFIRVFNREAHPGKPRTGIPSEDQSFTEKDNGTSEATEEPYVGRNAAVNDRESVFQLEKPRVHPEKVADPYEHSPTENSTTDSNDILFSDTSPGQKDSSASSTASITDDARATDEDADESSGTYFTVRELAQDESEQVQPTEDCEEIRTTDAKIRQWSRGKEGNIRSLLSTLQYVLWPGNRWKPVPLVDIIEGTAVKRSYQKALLCLHPDKLQQKGAASDQKYIAEQVFKILQEAWTHFNALGLVAP